jgi:CheY-like chemotaxis protein
MKILIVEDDKYKSDAINDCLTDFFDEPDIVIEESLSSGLFALNEIEGINLIILDMSMPSFDISDKDPTGGTPESYAGEDFLSHMSLLEMTTPVIVVTQFDNFNSEGKEVSLSNLSRKLFNDHYDVYKGSIYFKVSSSTWKIELSNLLKKVFK